MIIELSALANEHIAEHDPDIDMTDDGYDDFVCEC
jgi:hypothetical protein